MKLRFRTIWLVITLYCVYQTFFNELWLGYMLAGVVTFFIWAFCRGLEDDEELAADAAYRGVYHPRMADTAKFIALWWLFMGGGLVLIITLIVVAAYTWYN